MSDYEVPVETNPFDKFDAEETPIENARPSLGERFRGNVVDSFTRGTLAGAGGTLATALTTPDQRAASQREAEGYRNTNPTPMDGESPLQAQTRARAAQRRAARGVTVESVGERDARVREELANYEAMPEAKGFLENVAAFTGQLAGGIASPENMIGSVPGAGRLAGSMFAGKTAKEIAEAAISNAAVNLATDPAVQAMSIGAGVQNEYEPVRTAVAPVMGAVFGGGMRAAGEIPSAIERRAQRNAMVQRAPTTFERQLENPSGYVRQITPEIERREIAAIDPMMRRPGERVEPQASPVEVRQPVQPEPVRPLAGEATATMPDPPRIGDVELSAPQAVSLPSIRRDLGIDIPGTLIESPDSIKAFHGTPYDFDRFSLDKIGTGEGAQAYGHGLYFAERADVAESYQQSLSRRNIKASWDSKPIENWAAVVNGLESENWRVAKIVDELGRVGGEADRFLRAQRDWYRGQPEMLAAVDEVEKRLSAKFTNGNLYEIRIAAKPDRFLDWDKPFAEQTPFVQDAIRKLGLDTEGTDIWGPKTGKNLYDAITDNGSSTNQFRSSEALRNVGVMGIRYLDGASRRAGEGSRNYVVFDDTLIQIVAKNGQPLRKPIPIADYLRGESTARQYPIMTAPAVLKAQEAATAIRTAPQSVPAFKPDAAKPSTPDAPVGVFMFDANTLNTDARRFQYKDNGDAEGVTNALRAVTRWDAAKANQLIIWQDKANRLFVVDGHQRSGLARRLVAQGNEQSISLPGILYRESDGITPEFVRAIAAAKNIAEGSGSPIDGAKVLRSHPELLDGSMPITRTESRQAFDLARLGDEPFRMVINEVVPYQQAAVVGRLIPADVERQTAALTAIARFEPRNEMEATTLVQRVAQSELAKSEGQTGNLFGDMMGAESTVGEEMRIVARAIAELKTDKTLLSRVVANADRIEAAGSQINRGAARSVADEAEMFAKVITANAYSAGPVRDALIAAAREVNNGTQTVNEAARGILPAVRAEAERSLRTGAGDSAGDGTARSAVEPGADGKPQTLIPGVDPVTDRQRLDLQAGKPLTGGDAAPPAGGLFDTNARDQGSMFRMAREGDPAGAARPPATTATAAGAPDAPRNVAIQSLQQQVAALDDLFGVPFRQGRIERAKALGVYDTADGVIRIRNVADFETAVHEVGHHLENKVGGGMTGLIKANGALLGPLDYDQTKLRPQEGFAEWLSSYVTNPAKAERDAPGFADRFRAFLVAMGRDDVLSALDSASAAYRAYLDAPSNLKIEASIVPGTRETVLDTLKQEGFFPTVRMGMAKTYEGMFDDKTAVTRAVADLARAIREENGGKRLDLKAADNPDVMLRQADRAHQAAIGDLLNGVLAYHSTDRGPSLREAIMLATGGGSVTGRFDPVAMKEFSGYLYARRGLVLWDKFDNGLLEQRPVAQSRADLLEAIATYESARPTFREASNMVHAFTRAMLQKQFDGGLIDADLHARLMAEPFYVPMFRDMSDKPMAGDGMGGSSKGPGMTDTVKRQKGSDRDVIDPLANIMKQAFLVNRTLAHNDAVLAMDALATQAGYRGGRIFESVPAHQVIGRSFDLADGVMSAAKKHGLDPDETKALVASLADTFGDDPIMATIYSRQPTGARGEPILFYRKGGELYAGRFMADKEGLGLYEAFAAAPNVASDMMVNIVGAVTSTLRSGVTAHPMFLVTNYMRDQLTQFVLRPDFIPFYTGLKGSIMELRQTDAALLYAARGGVTAGAAIGSVDKIVDGEVAALAAKGYNVQRLKTFNGLIELMGVTETGTRLGIFENVYKRELAAGRTPYEAMVAAAWEGRDSMDFGRHGSKVGTWTRMVPFLNASIQGVDKARRVMIEPLMKAAKRDLNTVQDEAAVRNAAAAWVKTMAVFPVLGFFWAWMFGEKDAYKDAGGTMKATHLIMPTDDGRVFVVPKPFEVGLGINIGEEAYAHFMAKDPRAVHRLAEAAQEQLLQPFNPYRWMTQIPGIKTTFELSLNRSEFTKRDIVPEGMKNLPANDRYTARTSTLAKEMAKIVNVALPEKIEISPMQIEHIAGSLFGLYGRDMIAMSAAADARLKEYAEPGWEDTVGVRRLVKGEGSVRDTTSKFWEIAAARTGKIAAATAHYEEMLKRFDDTAAREFLAKQPETARSMVILKSAVDPDTGKPKFSADDRRLHPAVRGADAALILNGLRDELQQNYATHKVGDQRITIDPQTRGKLVSQIKNLTMMEMQNSLIALGEQGYAGRRLAPIKEQIEVIRAISPAVAEEIQQRYAQKKIYDFDAVMRFWPAVKRKLISEGGSADISMERAEVADAGYQYGGERVRQRNTRRRIPIPGTSAPPLSPQP